MSHLQYFAYPDHGVRLQEAMHYSQAVRVGDRIECAGQCGWDAKTGKVPEDPEREIANAFKNVDINLKSAGGKGWSQVYKVRLYVTDLSDEFIGTFLKYLREAVPDHKPILTGVKVASLSGPDMRLEVEVSAHVPETNGV
ncbi:hypothetical protein ACRALDRAFT_1026717 [Sodiomyces alcalophilus JCM 7366]|uniref:uncharacterized protein n=1 Tax=Sodiomyces alcalophilus JCM 7366 TaxID=591952 RepID=UPI0039B644CE